MKTEIVITSADAFEVMKLIEEYLHKGGQGLNQDALERVYHALGNADRITIVPSPYNGGDHANAA